MKTCRNVYTQLTNIFTEHLTLTFFANIRKAAENIEHFKLSCKSNKATKCSTRSQSTIK